MLQAAHIFCRFILIPDRLIDLEMRFGALDGAKAGEDGNVLKAKARGLCHIGKKWDIIQGLCVSTTILLAFVTIDWLDVLSFSLFPL